MGWLILVAYRPLGVPGDASGQCQTTKSETQQTGSLHDAEVRDIRSRESSVLDPGVSPFAGTGASLPVPTERPVESR